MINAKSLVAQVNLKSDENDNALKVVSETLSCFVDMFLHFFENLNYFLFHNVLFQFES